MPWYHRLLFSTAAMILAGCSARDRPREEIVNMPTSGAERQGDARPSPTPKPNPRTIRPAPTQPPAEVDPPHRDPGDVVPR